MQRNNAVDCKNGGGAGHDLSFSLEDSILTESKYHDWRVVNDEYILDEDLRLQILRNRLCKIIDDLQSQYGIRSKQSGSHLPLHKRVQDKRFIAVLDREVRERLDDVALSLSPSSWRLRERTKTVAVGLVVCLNIGTDPPDVVKAEPCARLESWVDPASLPPAKSLELIGRNLQANFEVWQPRAIYKSALDPTVEQVRNLCTSLRRNAKNERLLFHYNGHGVPRPTKNGEIWAFNSDYTQYIPISVADVKSWVGHPAIYTFDCSNAGLLLPDLVNDLDARSSTPAASEGKEGTAGVYDKRPHPNSRKENSNSRVSRVNISSSKKAHERSNVCTKDGTAALNECIILMACSAHETLPSSPEFPSDLFSCCLTTPLRIALRWFFMSHRTSMESLGLSIELVDHIPGKLNDRKTPLGELNWIFTAVTDTIAWTVLPCFLFRKLFRQDILVASVFRNFLLAERVLKTVNCNPISHPPLPSTWQHNLWEAWDMAVESCLIQLPYLIPDLFEKYGNSKAVGIGVGFSSPPQFRSNLLGNSGSLCVETSRQTVAKKESIRTTNAVLFNEKEKDAFPKEIGNHDLERKNDEYRYEQSSFFVDELSAFEIWLNFGANSHERRIPEQLPIVLQVLLSSFYRQRALDLLAHFLSLGSWAVSLSLSVGIFPYANKLLLSPDEKIRPALLYIWSCIMALDNSCQSDVVKEGGSHQSGVSQQQSASNRNVGHSGTGKQAWSNVNEGGHLYFLKELQTLNLSGDNSINSSIELEKPAQLELARRIGNSIRACFVLTAIMNGYSLGQNHCLKAGVLEICKTLLLKPSEPKYCHQLQKSISCLKEWLCFTVSKACEDNAMARFAAYRGKVVDALFPLLDDPDISVVQSCILALSTMIGTHCDPNVENIPSRTSTPHAAQKRDDSVQQVAEVPSIGHRRLGKNTNMPITRNQAKQLFSAQQGNLNDRESQATEASAKRHDCMISITLTRALRHCSPIVRREALFGLSRFVLDPRHSSMLQLAAHELNEARIKLGIKTRKESGSASACEAFAELNDDLMKKLSRTIGENAESYLKVWTAIEDLDFFEPFPAVSRVAFVLSSAVKSAVMRRIKAIRSHAGLKNDEKSRSDVQDAREAALYSRKDVPVGRNMPSASKQRTAATIEGPTNLDEDPRTRLGGGLGMTSSPQCSAIIMEMGLCSTLYERRSKMFSSPMTETYSSWIPSTRSQHNVVVDPLSKDGILIMTRRRRQIETRLLASVVRGYGAVFAGVSVNFENAKQQTTLFQSSNQSDENPFLSKYNDTPIASGDTLSTHTNQKTVNSEQQQVQSLLSHSTNLSSLASKKEVPAPTADIQRRLDKLTQARRDNGGTESNLWCREPTQAACIRAGLGFMVNDLSDFRAPIAASRQDRDLLDSSGVLESSVPTESTFKPVAIIEHGEEMCSKVLFHPFEPYLLLAHSRNDISVWKYVEQKCTSEANAASKSQYTNQNVNSFNNDTRRYDSQRQSGDFSEVTNREGGSRVTAMQWMNESSEPLLVVGSDDGSVRVWRDVFNRHADFNRNGVRLVTAWQAFDDFDRNSSGPGFVFNYQPRSAHLVCGGSERLCLWDIATETYMGTSTLPDSSGVTCIASYGQNSGLGGHGVPSEIDKGFGGSAAGGIGDEIFIVGGTDGKVRIFDKRVKSCDSFAANVALAQNNASCVVDIHVPTGDCGRTMCCGTVSGEIRVWDIRSLHRSSIALRNSTENEEISKSSSSEGKAHLSACRNISPLRIFTEYRSPLSAFACHPFAPILASGSHNQLIHVYNSQGEDLASIRWHRGALKQRIGPVSSLVFHPYKLLLAAGTLDSIVSVYGATRK